MSKRDMKENEVMCSGVKCSEVGREVERRAKWSGEGSDVECSEVKCMEVRWSGVKCCNECGVVESEVK